MVMKTSQSHSQNTWKQRQLTTRQTKIVSSVLADICQQRRKNNVSTVLDGHKNQSVLQPGNMEPEKAHHQEDKSSLICFYSQLSAKKKKNVCTVLMAMKTSQSHSQNTWKQRQLTTRQTKIVSSVLADIGQQRRKNNVSTVFDGHENQSVSQPEHTETAHQQSRKI